MTDAEIAEESDVRDEGLAEAFDPAEFSPFAATRPNQTAQEALAA